MSMGILGLMLVCILILILRPRRHVRPLPRAPNTVASLGLYVASVGSYEEKNFLDGMSGLYSLGLVDGNELRIDDDRRVRRLWSN
jgi:hypothetical protein